MLKQVKILLSKKEKEISASRAQGSVAGSERNSSNFKKQLPKKADGRVSFGSHTHALPEIKNSVQQQQ